MILRYCDVCLDEPVDTGDCHEYHLSKRSAERDPRSGRKLLIVQGKFDMCPSCREALGRRLRT